MKVALIKPPVLGHLLRGTGMYASELMKALEQRADVEVISCSFAKTPKDIDVFHFPYFDPFFLTLPAFRDKKTVVTIHDLIPLRFPQHFPRGVKGDIKLHIQKLVVKGVDAIITDSEASKADIIKYTAISPERIHVIYLAPAKIYQQLPNSKDIDHVLKKFSLPEKFVLYVGEMNWNKNVPSTIRACKQLNIPLVIVNQTIKASVNGNHAETQSLKEAQSLLGDDSRIHLVGKLESNELLVLYHKALALLYPSFYEGFGLPIVEAFAAGCPVVTSDKGSIKEISDSCTVVVDPENIDTIVNGLKRILLDQGLRQTLSTKAKKWVTQFTWHKTADTTVGVYKQLTQK
jgi:glycosyltransferase involved in cell wall biosynthesis